jgi:arginine decarboxylase
MCEYHKLDGSLPREVESGREVVSAGFVTPYPPGFPVLVPGQVVTSDILAYLKALDVQEIHGYDSNFGLRVFTQAALDQLDWAVDAPIVEPRVRGVKANV